jgi:IS5 family transposase
VDRAWSDGATQGDLPRRLRPPHRPGALGGGGGRLRHQGPLRRGEIRKKPGRQGQTGHQALDGGGRFGHPAERRECSGQSSHDSPLLVPTLEAASEALGALPEGASVHLDRGYDSDLSREHLAELGLTWEISGKGKPAPFWATNRWVVERTSSWHNAHKKLVWCTERVGRVIDFWVAFSDVVIIVRRLAREGWTRYRWEGRPLRRP